MCSRIFYRVPVRCGYFCLVPTAVAIVTTLLLLVLLVEAERVHDGRVARSNVLVLEGRGALKREARPAVHTLNTKGIALGQRVVELVHAVVVATKAVGNVHWSTGVVVARRVDCVVVNGERAGEDVVVAVDHQVDLAIVERLLKGLLAWLAARIWSQNVYLTAGTHQP